jgi:acyl-CoA synthetase (AMP-forming)/AMP-acid ligase II
MGVAAA